MDREFAHFDRLETAVRELGDAERAGVFGRTRIDVQALTALPVEPRRLQLAWVYRLGAIAAVLVAAVGVWSWMFVNQIQTIRERATPPVLLADAGTPDPSLLRLTGPAHASADRADLDGDRDLDLADFAVYQRQFGGVTR